MDCQRRIKAYDKDKLRDFRHINDSNRVFLCGQNTLGTENLHVTALAACFPENIQLLIHPLWWVYEKPDTVAVCDPATLSNLNQMQNQLVDTERAYGSWRTIDISLADAHIKIHD